jgi:hypothetical protein
LDSWENRYKHGVHAYIRTFWLVTAMNSSIFFKKKVNFKKINFRRKVSYFSMFGSVIENKLENIFQCLVMSWKMSWKITY